MRCPECGCASTKVYNSRPGSDAAGNSGAIRRGRDCLQCGHRFTTIEAVLGVNSLPNSVKEIRKLQHRLAVIRSICNGDHITSEAAE